jgi:hypothetical protein
MEDITVEELEMQIRRAAHSTSVSLPAYQLTDLLDLALRAAGSYHSLILKRLRKRIEGAEVEITGDEFRMVLDLALQTKLAEKKPRPRHLKRVPPPAKK